MKDLRKDFNYSASSSAKNKMSVGHEAKFKERLQAEFEYEETSTKMIYLKLAAVAIVAVISTVLILTNLNLSIAENPIPSANSTQISLGDVSPELKTIEDYYTASIKLELATIDISPEHELLVNSYIEELTVINRAYDDLEHDLNEFGVTEEVINAMIENLQLRLELLQDLKEKLNNLKQDKNENNSRYQM